MPLLKWYGTRCMLSRTPLHFIGVWWSLVMHAVESGCLKPACGLAALADMQRQPDETAGGCHCLLQQVDLEKWVEPARPLSQAEKDRAFIIDNNIFEVLPRHGSLAAGQAQQVSRPRLDWFLLCRNSHTVALKASQGLCPCSIDAWYDNSHRQHWFFVCDALTGLHPLQPCCGGLLLPAAVPAHQRRQAAAAQRQRGGSLSAAGTGCQGQPQLQADRCTPRGAAAATAAVHVAQRWACTTAVQVGSRPSHMHLTCTSSHISNSSTGLETGHTQLNRLVATAWLPCCCRLFPAVHRTGWTPRPCRTWPSRTTRQRSSSMQEAAHYQVRRSSGTLTTHEAVVALTAHLDVGCVCHTVSKMRMPALLLRCR